MLFLSLFVLIIAGGVLIRLGHILAGAAELNIGLYFLVLNMRHSQVRQQGLIVAPTRSFVPWESIQSYVWLDDSVSLFLQPEPSPWNRKMRQPVIVLKCIATQQEEFDKLLNHHLGGIPNKDAESFYPGV